MKIEFERSLSKKIRKQIERFEFDVGVLENKPHKDPKETPRFGEPDLGQYAGGPVRKLSRIVGPLTVAEIFVENMKRLNINLLLEPFRKKDDELNRFVTYFLRLVTKKPGTSIKRIENLLQAVVRNPILRKDYGDNSSFAADNKGFDRHLFDTGQMFRNIKARVKRVRR